MFTLLVHYPVSLSVARLTRPAGHDLCECSRAPSVCGIPLLCYLLTPGVRVDACALWACDTRQHGAEFVCHYKRKWVSTSTMPLTTHARVSRNQPRALYIQQLWKRVLSRNILYRIIKIITWTENMASFPYIFFKELVGWKICFFFKLLDALKY